MSSMRKNKYTIQQQVSAVSTDDKKNKDKPKVSMAFNIFQANMVYKPNYKNQVQIQKIFVNLTCINRTPVYSEHKSWSKGSLVYTGIILFPRPFNNYPFKILIVFGTSRF
jgi:hypothetical protein